MPAERIREIVEQTNALKPDVDRAARRFRRQPQVQDARRRAGGYGPRRWASSRRRSACTPSSATTTGGTISPRSARARARCSAGACSSARASPSTRTTPCASSRTAAASGSPASATSWPSSSGRRKRGLRRFEGVDDLDGTLAKVTDDAPVILLAHEPDIFPRVPDARVAHAFGPHPRRPGAPARLLADGALALRQPLRLRPRRRGQPPPRSSRAGSAARSCRCASACRLRSSWSMSQPPDQSNAAGRWPDLAGRLIEDASGRRHVLPDPRLLRGHGFLRPRLSRHLPALVRARPLRFPAPARQRPPGAVRRRGGARARGLRGAAHGARVPASPRASTRCWR